jgi:S-disulfanyl-L-cysteine oxidoreductase SoxD
MTHLRVLLMLALAAAATAFAAPLAHTNGINPGGTPIFTANGTWAVTLAAYCYEGFGYVEAVVMSADHTEIARTTVMGEGIARLVLDTDPGDYYVLVTPSYWHVYQWELLVEEGPGGDVAIREPLHSVSHAEHVAQLAAAQAAATEPADEEATEEGAAAEGEGHAHVHVPASIWEGIFTTEQAERGRASYGAICAGCHGLDLMSADGYAPDMTGFMFTSRWVGVTVANRFDRIHLSMPPGRGGTLELQTVADIVAYLLSANKYPAGEHELTPGEHLQQIDITAQP